MATPLRNTGQVRWNGRSGKEVGQFDFGTTEFKWLVRHANGGVLSGRDNHQIKDHRVQKGSYQSNHHSDITHATLSPTPKHP